MQRTIARIRPLGWAFAAVAASVVVSLMLLRPPAERLLPGAAPAERGHAGALILPAPQVAPPVHDEPAHSAPVAVASFLPRPQAQRPATTSAVSHARTPRSTKPVAPPKAKPSVTPTPTPTPPVATPAPPPPTPAPPPPPLQVASKRHGNGPPAHSNSRLLANRKQKKPAGHGKPPPPPPPPPPPTTAPAQPTGPPATPPGHGGTPPGQGGTPPGQGGTPPGHDKP
jgi:hypothetical protein